MCSKRMSTRDISNHIEGMKDVLGVWIGENEGAKFWLKVCTELKNRGVQDFLITCVMVLKVSLRQY